jgi:hypothetical protein
MRGRSGQSRRAHHGLSAAVGALLLACWLVLAPGASAARTEVNAGGLRLEPPASKVQIEFGPPAAGRREGAFTLLLRNISAIALRPRLTLDPAQDSASALGEPVLYLHLFGSAGGLVWLRSVGKVPTIAPGGIGRVALVVGLPASADPDSVDGTLVIHAVNSRLVPHGAPALLPIVASELDLSSVRAVPSSVALHTSAWLPGGRSASGTEADLDLRGLGVQALPASHHLNGRALLHSSDGQTVLAQVTVRREFGERRPVLRLLGVAQAGTYSGTVPISSSAQAPSLSVTLTARDAIVWTLAAVALGAFLGGLLPLLGKRARKRNFLRAKLEGSLIEYLRLKRRDSLMHWTGLSIEIGPDPAPWTSTKWLAQPALRGAAGLFSELHWARSEEELDKIKPKIDQLMLRIEAWIRLQPKVRELNKTARQEYPPIAGRSWSSTNTSKVSTALWQQVAWSEIAADQAKEKAQELQEQTEWHREVAGAWQRLAEAWDALENAAREDLLSRLLELTSSDTPRVGSDGAAGAPEPHAALAAFQDDLARERVKVRKAIAVVLRRMLSVTRSGHEVRLLGMLDPLRKLSRRTLETLHVSRRSTARVRTRPRRARVRRTLRGFTSRVGRVRSAPARRMAAARRQDVMLSIVAALGAMLVYALQIYTSTWGSLIDYLTAIASGFGAQGVVRWAALPLFESLRPSPAKADDSPPPPEPNYVGLENRCAPDWRTESSNLSPLRRP